MKHHPRPLPAQTDMQPRCRSVAPTPVHATPRSFVKWIVLGVVVVVALIVGIPWIFTR